jgi:hypothetical protein
MKSTVYGAEGGGPTLRKGMRLMSVFEALSLMIAFGSLIILLFKAK